VGLFYLTYSMDYFNITTTTTTTTECYLFGKNFKGFSFRTDLACFKIFGHNHTVSHNFHVCYFLFVVYLTTLFQ
jgi:hypothetical protein